MKTLGRFFFAPDSGAGSGGGSAGGGTPPPATPPAQASSILSAPPQASGGGTPPPAAPPPASLSFKELVTEDGGLHDNWPSVLPEELRDDPSFKNIKTFPALAKSYRDAQKLVGAEKVALPGKNATKEEYDAFFNKLGRPETADKYQFQKPEKLPEGVNWNEEQLKVFKSKAHEAGLTQKQFEELVNWHTGVVAQGLEKMNEDKVQAQQDSIKELQKSWGSAFNQELEKARRAAALFGSLEDFEAMGVADNPKFLQFLAKVGSTISEDRMRGHDTMMVPVDAKAKIAEIQGNKEHPYHIKDHPGHEMAVQEMKKLFSQAYPEPVK